MQLSHEHTPRAACDSFPSLSNAARIGACLLHDRTRARALLENRKLQPGTASPGVVELSPAFRDVTMSRYPHRKSCQACLRGVISGSSGTGSVTCSETFGIASRLLPQVRFAGGHKVYRDARHLQDFRPSGAAGMPSR